jgi:gamma-glutamyltranspeptidase/glutathione hydrolase
MRHFVRLAALFLYALVHAAPLGAQASVTQTAATQTALARHGMVASQEARATRIGVAVLEKGGNAVDAAVAVGFALAVTHPQAGNIGGGGFMLIHLAERGETVAIDYRETAPQAMTAETFLDDRGEADPKKSQDSALAVGVPGTVAGLTLALERYGSGRFSLGELIAPAIALAREGIPVEDDLADSLKRAAPRLVRWSSSRIFFGADGAVLGSGDRLVQAQLADSLAAIAGAGAPAFYRGTIAEKIVASTRNAGGLLGLEDLASYRATIREPVHGRYRGHDIVSMPPPSSGGVALIETLNILEGYDLKSLGDAAPHFLVEAMKRAYADRAEFLGDPDAVHVPVDKLISKAHAAQLRATIRERATPASVLRARAPVQDGSDNTTHFSIVDRFGNAVANTYTLNFSYGLGLVAEGTGILLNNELDDFAAKPGSPNAYGLVGSAANAPGPGKRPLSSMTPTIVLRDGNVMLVTGSPGGSRIITTALQVALNVIDLGMNIGEAVAQPRLHHQWLPDEVVVEPDISPDVIAVLERRGHAVREAPRWGSANSILMTQEGLVGAADPRTRGSLAAGH